VTGFDQSSHSFDRSFCKIDLLFYVGKTSNVLCKEVSQSQRQFHMYYIKVTCHGSKQLQVEKGSYLTVKDNQVLGDVTKEENQAELRVGHGLS
jgi:hypothetical protein